MDDIEKTLVEALDAAHELEINWLLYHHSGGAVRGDRLRAASLALERFLRAAITDYADWLSRPDDANALGELASWAGDPRAGLWPWGSPRRAEIFFELVVQRLKNDIEQALHIEGFRRDLYSAEDRHVFNRRQFWGNHVSAENIPHDAETFTGRLTAGGTITVCADIRQSQELMLHTSDPVQYRNHMSDFIECCRELVTQSAGIFDKFTGDGFVAYFSPVVQAPYDADFDCSARFLAFCQALMAFAARHFENWSRIAQKIPPGGYGLALGADYGDVHFDDSQRELICIGQPIVWASRLCAAAPAGTVLVNNRLASDLLGRDDCSLRRQVLNVPKTGDMTAWILSVSADFRGRLMGMSGKALDREDLIPWQARRILRPENDGNGNGDDRMNTDAFRGRLGGKVL